MCARARRETQFRTELEMDCNRPMEECPVHPMGRLLHVKRVLLTKFGSIMHTWFDMCAKFPQMAFPAHHNFIETLAACKQWLQDPVQQQRDVDAAAAFRF